MGSPWKFDCCDNAAQDEDAVLVGLEGFHVDLTTGSDEVITLYAYDDTREVARMRFVFTTIPLTGLLDTVPVFGTLRVALEADTANLTATVTALVTDRPMRART